MSLLTATNGNVQLAADLLSDLPAGAYTLAALWRRDGTTTDGFEAITALVTGGGSVRANLGTDAAAEPYEVRFAQGGTTVTFGFNDLSDADAYLCVVLRPAGTATPRGNLYRFDGWTKVADVKGGTASQTWGNEGRRKTFDPKAVWVFVPAMPAERKVS